MGQFLGILIFLLIWIVPAILRANAKKKKAAEMMAAKRRMNTSSADNQPVYHQQKQSSSQEVEKMLEKLLGVEVSTKEGQVSFEEALVQDEDKYESVEYQSLESHFNIGSDNNYELQRGEKLSFDELIAMGESDAGLMVENIDDGENNVHQVLSDFDLRKAVIYSEILKPRYF